MQTFKLINPLKLKTNIMKKVFQNTSEVVHVFAQQSQSEGRNQSGSIYFRDNKIYSYGSHYLLGEFINSETIIINDFGYSVTTSKHISELINATIHYNRFWLTLFSFQGCHRIINADVQHCLNIPCSGKACCSIMAASFSTAFLGN